MLPATPVPLLILRLDTEGTPWRLPREADLRVRLVNIPLARAPEAPGLPFSFAALPSRYLPDLIRQSWQENWKGPTAILNPGLQHHPGALFAVMAETEDLSFGSATGRNTSWLVLQDYDERVVAYVLPPGWRAEADVLHDLRYLSGTDAALDTDLLAAIGIDARLRKIRVPQETPAGASMPVFHGMERMAVKTARARLNMLRAGERHTLAIVTHHAGDVLLAVQAIEACGRHIDGIVVHAAYADVARAVQGKLPIIEVQGPLPARGDISSPAHPLNEEILYFEQVVMPALPMASSFLFVRPSRGYIDADHTMAAQLAYTVGQLGDELRYPRAFTLEAPDSESIAANQANLPRLTGRRVLLHFDGGWPLKVYPREWQRELIDRLRDAGFEPSVLGASFPDVPSHQFTNLGALTQLMREHDFVIAMDSFPSHYASQALGIPTFCLFASTRMENLAHAAENYMAVEQGLYCSPCGSRNVCPRFGGTICHNFVTPAVVTELVLSSFQEP